MAYIWEYAAAPMVLIMYEGRDLFVKGVLSILLQLMQSSDLGADCQKLQLVDDILAELKWRRIMFVQYQIDGF